MGTESGVRVNRRGFLAALGLATGAIAVPELWTPKRTFFLPPRGGWVPPPGTVAIQNPYTYRWVWLSGGSGLTITSPLAHSTAFEGFGEGLAVCEVTDSVGHRHASTSVAIVQRFGHEHLG